MEQQNEHPKSVFISYSHKNGEACEKIDGMLEKRGDFSVWYDRGLIPGEVFRKRIAEVIRDSEYFIILLSKDSVASDWVLDEVEYAKKLRKKILPIWLENVDMPDDLDMILQRYHSLFWHLRSSDEQFESNLLSMFDVHEDVHGKAAVGFGNHFSERVNQRMRALLDRERDEAYEEIYTAENACLLGVTYLFGGPCNVDRDRARHYFRAAEYFGSADAEFYLLEMQLEDRRTELWDEPDTEFCRPIIERITALAEAGSVPAKLFLGNACWHGHYGLAADMEKSAAYYEECARLGNARAQFVMSSNYYNGEGVAQDYELAKMYANLAMGQKYIYSWRRWGKFYRDGFAVEQDYEKAKAFYEKGAQMGDFNCYNKLGDMAYHGWGGPVDYAQALTYFQSGADAPSAEQRYSLQRSMTAIGRAYELGHGVEKDLATAAEKYLEGYKYGSIECRDAYLRCSEALGNAPSSTGDEQV